MFRPILSTEAFYAQESSYRLSVDPTWDSERWYKQAEQERATQWPVLGLPEGGSVLDCSCGTGAQAVVLAQLGWRVTATDVAEASLQIARRHAMDAGVDMETVVSDMRDLASRFSATFDGVITCMALDNIPDDEGILQAVRGTYAVLKPGGTCYVRLRDFDHLAQVRPRYDMREERVVPHGRVIRLEDWEFESETHAINTYIYLQEDSRLTGYRWSTHMFSYRRRALRKRELSGFLSAAGFQEVELLPQANPWTPYEVVARKRIL